MITTILFDLDGTLLPMDQEEFTSYYFKRLVKKMIPMGYDPKELIDAVWMGTAAMVKNNGTASNEEVFWNCFEKIYPKTAERDRDTFEAFYHNEFQEAQAVCPCNPAAKEVVDYIKEKEKRVVLATNPIFPRVATQSRICWAGLSPEDFEYYTTYENSTFCKPNPSYYKEVLEKIGCNPTECLMVGNDVTEDMVAKELGMQVFLLTDCIINKEEKDIEEYPHGDFNALKKFLEELD